PQGHLGTLLKNRPNVLLVVFAAETQEHAGFPLRSHEFLQGDARLVEADASRTVLAANAGPECLVQIEDDDFMRRSAKSVEFSGDGRGQCCEKLRRVRNMP